MIFPTIRCAHPTCQCIISMANALRVGTNHYCSVKCAKGEGHCGHTSCSKCQEAPHTAFEIQSQAS